VISAGCYRDLGVLECDTPSPPAHCVEATTATTATTATSSETGTNTHEPDSSAGVDSSSSSTDDSADSGTTASVDSTDTDTGTSTGAAPFCGDGTLDESEECDDGNLVTDDGCNACKRDRLMFVSSEPGFLGGMLQGLKGADNYCVSRAGQAGFENFLKFKAFLSDSQTDAVDRLFAGEGRYVLVDGTVVADNWQALLTGPLQHPIELTELGEVLHRPVWTGTRHGDGRAVPGSMHCDDWTSVDPDKKANFGWSDEVDANWTQSEVFNPDSCGSMNVIYCIEQR
jgi:cysteine-rich repeat protein